MNRYIFLFLIFAFTGFSSEARDRKIMPDTTLENPDLLEDALIDDILKTRSAPKKEKVEYFSQVTRYGFKNLFNNLSYNPAMPYHNQVNPYAENYMQDYLASHGASLQKMRNWAGPYFGLIDNVLAQYGLPKELKYLAVIESNLQSGATSWVGARGPWQFMPGTARDMGLTVNGYIDERTDYYKSTHAAARYLLVLYKDLKDWLLVVAAYNGGPGRVYSAINKSGSRNFWALQYSLPAESRNHVKKFIATHYIMEANSGDVLMPIDYSGLTEGTNSFTKPSVSDEDAATTEVLNVSGKYNSLVLAKNITYDITEFNRLNPGFDMMMSTGENYDLRLPSDKMALFVANKYAILNESVQLLINNVKTETKTVYTRAKVGQTTRKKG